MFLQDPEFRSSVAAILKVKVDHLASYWDQLCKDCHESAYYDIRGALLLRGFTSAQIDAWSRGPEYERDIGAYWCLVRGVGQSAYSIELIDRLDRRKELQTVHVEIAGGTPQVPSGSPAAYASGSLNTTNDTWTKDMQL